MPKAPSSRDWMRPPQSKGSRSFMPAPWRKMDASLPMAGACSVCGPPAKQIPEDPAGPHPAADVSRGGSYPLERWFLPARYRIARGCEREGLMSDLADLYPGFASHWIDTAAGRIFARTGGKGAPLLLIHGHPQTNVMWHRASC